MRSPNPYTDPFFAPHTQRYEGTLADHCRQQRKLVREYSQTTPAKFGQFMFRLFVIPLVIGFFVVPVIVIAALILEGGWIGVLIGLVLSVIVASIPIYFWKEHQKIVKAFEQLVRVHGGSWGERRLLSILDWLDLYWPAAHPLEVATFFTLFERRWDWQSTFGNRHVLLVVHRQQATGESIASHNPTVERMSFFLTSPTPPPDPLPESHPALLELEKLGYWVKRTDAGFVVSHTGIAVEKLDPPYVQRVLEIARRIG